MRSALVAIFWKSCVRRECAQSTDYPDIQIQYLAMNRVWVHHTYFFDLSQQTDDYISGIELVIINFSIIPISIYTNKYSQKSQNIHPVRSFYLASSPLRWPFYLEQEINHILLNIYLYFIYFNNIWTINIYKKNLIKS